MLVFEETAYLLAFCLRALRPGCFLLSTLVCELPLPQDVSRYSSFACGLCAQFPWFRFYKVFFLFSLMYFFFACEVYAQAVSCYLRFACELYAQAHVEHASLAPRLCGVACEVHCQARQTFCVRDFSVLLTACRQRQQHRCY